MKKEIVRRNVVRTIEEEVELEIYISKDGTIFDNEDECTKHEEELNFTEYFENKYKVKSIDPFEYGLNLGHTNYCHLVWIKKISNEIIDEFVRYYKLEDHPDDIIKIKEGWSFVALVSDVNLWVFDKSDRLFTVLPLEEAITIKRRELKRLNQLV